MSEEINLFEFASYRSFLDAWLKQARLKGTSNLTRLAQIVGVHPTYLSHVLHEQKDLSLEQAALLCEHLKLTKLEYEYFFVLLQLERAGSVTLKNYFLDKKKEILNQKNQLSRRFETHRELSDADRAVYYSSWLYAAISIATEINGGQTLSQLAQRFNLHREATQKILDFLLGAGIIKEVAGLFQLGDIHVHVPNESPFVTKHHVNWRLKSMRQMDIRDPTELFLTAPMSISLEDFDKIREILNVAVKEAVDIAKLSPAKEVVCLNIDFFKVIEGS